MQLEYHVYFVIFFALESTTVTAQSNNGKRYHDDLLLSSSEPTTYETEQSDNDKRVHDDLLLTSSSEPTTTIEQSDNDKRVHDDYLLSTTVDSSTPIVEVERRVFKDDLENEIETVDGKREMPVQLLTNNTVNNRDFLIKNLKIIFIVLVIININTNIINCCSKIFCISIINFNININGKIYWSS